MGRRQKEQEIREASSYWSQAQINTSCLVGLGEEKGTIFLEASKGR